MEKLLELHHLLKRQLKRCGINDVKFPTLEQWQNFLDTLNRTYNENDQERYLLERSMEISSKEALDLNDKLEHAQQIAHLGYWFYDKKNDIVTFSKEMYHIIGASTTDFIPSYKNLLQCVSVDDRILLNSLIEQSFNTGKNYEMEVKIKTLINEVRWCFFAGNPHLPEEENQPIRYLSGIIMDITTRKEAEAELHKLNKQLISAARRAGMSEVATAVLHNIGNILNSVNISVGLMQKYLNELDFNSLISAYKMILDNKHHLDSFLSHDEKGKLLPVFIQEEQAFLISHLAETNNELQRLIENIQHIKTIVTMQSTLSGAPGLLEDILIQDLIFPAIDLNKDVFKKHNIEFKTTILSNAMIQTDKNKVLQILVNLLQNAKDSVALNKISHKHVTLHCNIIDEFLEIKVSDNGIGIPAENLKRMFTFGFTTKLKGHGFGLHSSALLAKELGGKLQAYSKGLGYGAEFILQLPLMSDISRRKSHVQAL